MRVVWGKMLSVSSAEIHIDYHTQNGCCSKNNRQNLGELYLIIDYKRGHIFGTGNMPADKADNNNNNLSKFLFVKHVADQADEGNQEPGVGKEAAGVHIFELLQHLGGMNEFNNLIKKSHYFSSLVVVQVSLCGFFLGSLENLYGAV